MKKFIFLFAFMFLVSSMTFDTMGMGYFNPPTSGPIGSSNGNGNGGAVGAPLDGGLLALLGIAGAAYFTARKKKKGTGE